MEMAKTCFAERTTGNHQKGTSMDARREEKQRKTENNLEKNSRERDESHAALLGFIDEAGSGHRCWDDFAAAIHTGWIGVSIM